MTVKIIEIRYGFGKVVKEYDEDVSKKMLENVNPFLLIMTNDLRAYSQKEHDRKDGYKSRYVVFGGTDGKNSVREILGEWQYVDGYYEPFWQPKELLMVGQVRFDVRRALAKTHAWNHEVDEECKKFMYGVDD